MKDDDAVEDVAWFPVEHASSVGTARRAAAAVAAQLGFDDERIGEIALVVSELASNLVKHASSGSVLVRVRRGADEPFLEVLTIDGGPGMADVAAALQDGTSSAGTLGIGLGALRRLATDWDIWSWPGAGTAVVASFARAGADVDGLRAAGLTRPMTGQSVCGDAYAIRRDDDVLTVLLADGLGHGPLAAAASLEAVRRFRAAPAGSPAALLTAVHRGLSGTRGAAAAIAQVRADEVRYAGIGNVVGTIVEHESRRGMISHPGIAGGQARTIRETSYPLPAGALVVMHSDGVTEKQSLERYPGLRMHSPLLTAAVVLRDFGTRPDDASVVVVRAAA